MESREGSIGDSCSSTNILEIGTEVVNFKLLRIPKEVTNIEDKWPWDTLLKKNILKRKKINIGVSSYMMLTSKSLVMMKSGSGFPSSNCSANRMSTKSGTYSASLIVLDSLNFARSLCPSMSTIFLATWSLESHSFWNLDGQPCKLGMNHK